MSNNAMVSSVENDSVLVLERVLGMLQGITETWDRLEERLNEVK